MSVDWNRYKTIVLQRLRATWSQMSDYMRNLPTYPFQDPDTMKEVLLSPNQVIREVEMLTELGRKIIVAESMKMGELQP